jgi:hypothetical protein
MIRGSDPFTKRRTDSSHAQICRELIPDPSDLRNPWLVLRQPRRARGLLKTKSRLQTALLFSSALEVNLSSEVDYHELE